MSTTHAPLATDTGGMARGGGEVIDFGGQPLQLPSNRTHHSVRCHTCAELVARRYHCSDGRSDRVYETDDVARPAGDRRASACWQCTTAPCKEACSSLHCPGVGGERGV